MKKLLVVLLVLIVAALGGYTFYWNKKADEVKTLITDGISNINNYAKPYTGNDKTIQFESAQTSGWPFHVNVTLVKPVITIPVHSIAKFLNEAESKKAAANPLKESKLNVAPDTTWTETYSGDAIVISTDLMATNLTLAHEGEQRAVSTFNGVQSNPLVYRAAIPHTCTLNVTRAEGASLFDVEAIFKDAVSFAKRFREFSCNSRGINSADGKTNEVIATTESMLISFSMDISNKAQTTGRLILNVKNQKATKAMDKVFTNYLNMIYRLFLNQEADMSIMGIPMSELGNNSFEVDISFNGPTDPALFISKDMVLNAGINKFSVQNDLMKIDSEMHIKSNPAQNPEQRDSAFVLRSTGKYTARFDELKLKEIQMMVERLLKEDGEKDMKELRETVLKKLKIEEVRQAIDELWPRFSPYGNITFAIDVAAKTANPPLSPTGEVTLNNLDFVTSVDGVKISGKGEQKGPMPSGEVKLTCLACDNLLNRTFAYIKLVDKWVARIDEKHVASVSDELFQGFKHFLKDLSVPSKDATGKEMANDWFYHIKMTGEGEPTLNDKPLMKAMESFGQNVAPHLPAPGGAAPLDDTNSESKFEPLGAVPDVDDKGNDETGEEEKPTN